MNGRELVPPPQGIVVYDGEGDGCRILTTRPFAAGETIERAPIVPLSARERKHLAATTLGAFMLPWGDEGAAWSLALGYGALYRASDAPNARHVQRVGQRTLGIVADRSLESGEEILVPGEPGNPAVPMEKSATLTPPDDVRWGETDGRGLGVFATRDFAAGETIERTPCITFAAREWKPVEKTILDEYGFLWGADLKDGALPLGYGAVYNHSFEPNACYVRRLAASIMDFVAIRDIPAGAEIRTNYNRDPRDMSPVWFDVVE